MGGIITKKSEKPFYVKYFKSKLEPENLCTMYDVEKKELFDATEDVELPYWKGLEEYKNAYRVDLFVCARDRALRCPFYYDTQNKEWATLEEVEQLFGSLEMAMNDATIIPVLGYASPKQWWLNQGDELDYSEVEPCERWYERGSSALWLRMRKVDFESIDQTNFVRERVGDALRAISIKNSRTNVFV